MANTRPSNLGALSDTVTVSDHDATLTATFAVQTVKYPWQSGLSNDLPLSDTTRPSNGCVHGHTTARLSHDAPLQRS